MSHIDVSVDTRKKIGFAERRPGSAHPLEAVQDFDAGRRFLLQNLHDGVGQHLVSMLLDLKMLAKHVSSPEGQRHIDRLLRQVDALGLDVRKVLRDVRAVASKTDVLSARLGALVDEWGVESDIDIRFTVRGGETALPGPLATALISIATEAITNVRKHATDASSVTVQLAYDREFVSLTIADDGAGFVWNGRRDFQALAAGGRFGLVGMRERMAAFGGRLHVATAPGCGLVLKITAPLCAEACA